MNLIYQSRIRTALMALSSFAREMTEEIDSGTYDSHCSSICNVEAVYDDKDELYRITHEKGFHGFGSMN